MKIRYVFSVCSGLTNWLLDKNDRFYQPFVHIEGHFYRMQDVCDMTKDRDENCPRTTANQNPFKSMLKEVLSEII